MFVSQTMEPVNCTDICDVDCSCLKSLPKRSIADVVGERIREKEVVAGIALYRELKTNSPKNYIFQQKELNTVGYMVLQEMRDPEGAIEIFKLNIEIYPSYANGYDSLAEAYMAYGEMTEAIKFSAKSLEMNPKKTNAKEKLNEINKKSK